MNKVKLTQEQARAIEEIKNDDEDVDSVLNYHSKINGKWDYFAMKPLNEMPVSELAKALYIGYEVMPQFEVGEWVKSKLGKGVGIIIDVDDSEYYTDFGMIVPKHDDLIRYATDEEIAKEKQRRDEKLDKILLELTDYERERLTVKLAGGNE